jgi:hypothetical protein
MPSHDRMRRRLISRTLLVNSTATGHGETNLKGEPLGVPPTLSHVLACMYAPRYVAENPAGLQIDWPRIPLPGTPQLLRASAELGRSVAALLDVEQVVPGVSGGTLREELKLVGHLIRVDGASGPVDLGVRAAWG